MTQAEEDSDPDIADDSCSTPHRGKRLVGRRVVGSISKSMRSDARQKQWRAHRPKYFVSCHGLGIALSSDCQHHIIKPGMERPAIEVYSPI